MRNLTSQWSPFWLGRYCFRNLDKIPAAAYDSIGNDQLIWVQKEHAKDEDWLLTMAFDLVITQISEAPIEFTPLREEDKKKLWYGTTITKITVVLSGNF